MAKESFMYPTHIPVDPKIYALLSQAFCDENLRDRMFQAVQKYNEGNQCVTVNTTKYLNPNTMAQAARITAQIIRPNLIEVTSPPPSLRQRLGRGWPRSGQRYILLS